MRRALAVLAVTLAAVAAGCGSDEEPETPAASVERLDAEDATTTTARSLTPEEEVEAAYLRSWEVYARAVRELDPSGLEESYAGDALETVRAEVARLAEAGTPVVVDIEHGIRSIELRDAKNALVRDLYINRNYRLDEAGEPLDDLNDPGTYLESYQLRRDDAGWRVVRIVRESYQP